jgi:hypothetical protein
LIIKTILEAKSVLFLFFVHLCNSFLHLVKLSQLHFVFARKVVHVVAGPIPHGNIQPVYHNANVNPKELELNHCNKVAGKPKDSMPNQKRDRSKSGSSFVKNLFYSWLLLHIIVGTVVVASLNQICSQYKVNQTINAKPYKVKHEWHEDLLVEEITPRVFRQ